MKINKLDVSVTQGFSGALKLGSQYVYSYNDETRPELEVGLRYPAVESPFVANFLAPIFTMNQPEGYLAEKIRQRMAKVPYNDLFLLALTGDNQIGRLSYSSSEYASARPEPQVGLSDILESRVPGQIFEFLVEKYFASGVSGVQPKVLAPNKDDDFSRRTMNSPSLIVKSGMEEYEGLSQNEFLCMDAARIAGLSVPDFHLSDNRELFVMNRFDLNGDKRLGFEDISVLLNIPSDRNGEYKYRGSYEVVAEVIKNTCPNDPAELEAFYDYLCLSIMVKNGDAHLKNFGILYEHPGETSSRKLSPIYDVTTTAIYPAFSSKYQREVFDNTMALKLRRGDKYKDYPGRDDLLRFGKEVIGLRRPEENLDKIASAMRESLAINKGRVESELFEKMRLEWEKGIGLALTTSAAKRNSRRPASGGQTRAKPDTDGPQV